MGYNFGGLAGAIRSPLFLLHPRGAADNMIVRVHNDRTAWLATLIFLALVAARLAPFHPGFQPQASAQPSAETAAEAYASRDALVRAGLEANRKTLDTVVEYSVALEGLWQEKTAGKSKQPPPVDMIPEKTSALDLAVESRIQDMRRAIDQAKRLQAEASTTRDGKLALMLATDAASWTNRALHAAQELRTPIVRLSATPSAPTQPGSVAPSPAPAQSPAPSPTAVPGLEGRPVRNMEELSRHLDELSGRVATPQIWDERPDAAPSAVGGSRFATNLTGLFQHLDELSGERSIQADLDFIELTAEREFGEGRAGAGGIALFKAAELLSPLELDKVEGLAWKDGRFVLRFGQREIALPRIDPEFFALALRCVNGNEATYEGRLVADEANSIAIQTGRARFGELVWNKQFLPEPFSSAPIGSTVKLQLGPGLGLLAELKPSLDRVTYYGPIGNTRMGKVLLDSDQVISLLFHGVDPQNGRPAKLGIERFQTFFERNVRGMLERASAAGTRSKPPTGPIPERGSKWWAGATWMVWVPDRFSMRLAEDGKQLEFADSRMKLETWTAGAGGVPEPYASFGSDVTARYDELASLFPALKELREVAKAVCVARWLKQRQIRFDDPNWAVNFPLQPATTPATASRFAVEPLLVFDRGLPLPVMDKETSR
jgi:hypothetical protein